MAGEKVTTTPGLIRIGILDSGVGGLSVLKEIHAILPANPLFYFGDSAWCPYGTKSAEAICKRVLSITDYLLSKEVAMIVIACNSATIHAIEMLRANYPIPIVGMEPAVKPAAEMSKSGVVSILATEASIAGEKFHHLVNTHARSKGVTLINQPCPKFVELVEDGILQGPQVDAAVKEITAPLLRQKSDVFVLGCTHYPFLRTAIEAALPDGVQLIDTGPAVARRVKSLLPAVTKTSEAGKIIIETSGAIGKYHQLLPELLPGIKYTLQPGDVPF